jgi:hypothetical protein
MNNLKFPNFNFDAWVEDYAILVEQLLNKEVDIGFVTTELREAKDNFYTQNHTPSDAGYCTACLYFRDLNEFNIFMRLVGLPDVLLSDVKNHFCELLRMSYMPDDKLEFIKAFFKTHQIEYIDDNGNTETNL